MCKVFCWLSENFLGLKLFGSRRRSHWQLLFWSAQVDFSRPPPARRPPAVSIPLARGNAQAKGAELGAQTDRQTVGGVGQAKKLCGAAGRGLRRARVANYHRRRRPPRGHRQRQVAGGGAGSNRALISHRLEPSDLTEFVSNS